MKIKEGFVLREVMGNNIVIAVGEASRSFRGMVQLNDTATLIWKLISEGNTKEQIVDALLEKYDADREILEADVDKSIKMLVDNGLVEL